MKSFLQYLLALALLSLAFLLYFSFYEHVPYPYPAGPRFDKRVRMTYLNQINETHPDIVLMGDSMLKEGIDTDKLEQGLDKEILNIALPGSGSTLWYLILKNNIARSATPPANVVLFFRDSELTVPGLRVQGKYLEQIDEFASSNDQVLLQRAYVNLMSPLEIAAEKFYPPYQFRWQVRTALDRRIRYTLSTYLLDCSEECTDQAMTSVFEGNDMEQGILSNAIDAADEYLYRDESLDFGSQVEVSFLPEFIHLSKENHIQLVVVHMKTLRFSAPNSEPPTLVSYRNDLEEYLAQNGVIYLDFTEDARIQSSYFSDPLHLTEEGRQAFTQIFIDTFAPYMH
jgi:hypothetical protein